MNLRLKPKGKRNKPLAPFIKHQKPFLITIPRNRIRKGKRWFEKELFYWIQQKVTSGCFLWFSRLVAISYLLTNYQDSSSLFQEIHSFSQHNNKTLEIPSTNQQSTGSLLPSPLLPLIP